MDFTGRVVIVTGAAGGIGRATCVRLGSGGARVVAVDRDEAGLDETADAVAATGAEVSTVTADVRRGEDVRGYVAYARETFGGRIDGFFNNAGIEGQLQPITECTEENFDAVISVNLRGVFLGLRYVLPVMVEQGAGAVVNTASIASERGFPLSSPYVAAKHAVIGLTRTAATEVGGAGVRVNAVMPGMIDTRMLHRIVTELGVPGETEEQLQTVSTVAPINRAGSAAEVGEVVCFLLSDASSYVNGVGWAIDGGVLAAINNAG
jgi:NAD(P)-dependent dehydrogenase (short-subunit alcohol dehydrogenase family)